MLVKVNTSLAGADFSYNFGDEVDSEEFAARVGNGWENLCDSVAIERAVIQGPDKVAAETAAVEAAVVAPAQERRGRRK